MGMSAEGVEVEGLITVKLMSVFSQLSVRP